MYLFSMTLYPNEKQQEDDYKSFQEEQAWYFSALYKNGQILINGCNTVRGECDFTTYFLVPEKDSLDPKNNNKYVNEFYAKLLGICQREPRTSIIGKSSDYGLACSCNTPSWYMLYSDYTTHESPIVCGDCGLSVPLYKLPKILGEDEFYTVLGWQTAYNSCDNLFMQGIGERGAYQRLSKPSSDLSKLGEEICREFEKVKGMPFYYYLFRYYSSHKLVCPVCGEDWKLGEENTLFVDYRCEHCRLVADEVKKKS
jgi:predicted  nucleic acid-binding Zn ribbon protein